MEIHPKMGGGHIVKHVYSGYEHDPMEVHFDEDGKRQGKGSGGEHVMAHLQKHAGLPRMQATNPTMQEEEEEEEE
jgi:hypothetical protein